MLKVHLAKGGLLGRPGKAEHVNTLCASYLARSPGFAPVLKAVSGFVSEFADAVDPSKVWESELWKVA